MVVFLPNKAPLMEDAELSSPSAKRRHGEASGQLDLESYDDADARDTQRSKHGGRRVVQIICVIAIASWLLGLWHWPWPHRSCRRHSRPHFRQGRSPWRDDPFHFIPCTNNTIPPALDDPYPEHTWAEQYDPDWEHWSWGTATLGWEKYFENSPLFSKPYGPHEPHDDPQEPGRPHAPHRDPYAGRGIYLCGYLDVPLDYTNKSDTRIARLAVTKYQVSGLAGHDRRDSRQVKGRHGAKSERTIVIEPGGPGGSGISMAWGLSEEVSRRFSDGKYDVLGWDPRGVNASQPAIACFPHDVDRDHWSARVSQYRESSSSPRAQLEFADAMNESIFAACKEIHGDLPRFVSTAFVARDLEEIRKALGEDELTGYLVSYGTGIGQTYSSMFPNRVGRIILDGTEYVRDQRMLGGFGWAALDNATDAWHDGFLGECVAAGADHCALAKPYKKGNKAMQLADLDNRMEKLIKSLIKKPVIGYTESNGPTVVTYSALVSVLYSAMYVAKSWPAVAQMLAELEAGNSTLTAQILERSAWQYDPTDPAPITRRPSTDELANLVICADQYDAVQPEDGIAWYDSLWANMTKTSWIAGNSRFLDVLPCRHFSKYWPQPAEVYRGDLNMTLSNPLLLIAETYDPATPLRNGRRLLHEMGRNARLIAHHGYGHSSRDTSSCTNAIAKAYILHGELPDEPETACYADKKPYLYSMRNGDREQAPETEDPLEVWDELIKELAILNPRLL